MSNEKKQDEESKLSHQNIAGNNGQSTQEPAEGAVKPGEQKEPPMGYSTSLPTEG